MSSLHPARRGAERFNALLDAAPQADRGAHDVELLELVGALQSVPQVQARPAFVADLRERLMLAAETELLVPDSPAALDELLTVRTRRTPRERRLAVALGGFAIVGATTSMAVASQSAIPGDVLYPLKRAIESAEAGFSVGDEAKGSTLLENASGRLDEVDELAHQDDVDTVAVSETLTTFADQAGEASELLMADYAATGSEESINELRDFTSSSIEELSVLEEVIPEGAGEALLDAAQVLFEIDTLAASLCPLCESPGITQIPGPLLASGDAQLDAANVATAAGSMQDAQPGQDVRPGQGGKGPLATMTETAVTDGADPADPTGAAQAEPNGPGQQLPTPNSNGAGNGHPHNPLGSSNVSIPASLPPVGLPAVDGVVSDAVDAVNEIVGGLANKK